MRFKNWNLVFVICLLSCFLYLVSSASAASKAYDGIWFMGFKTNEGPFKSPEVRQAVNSVISKNDIALKLASKEAVPVSVIPPGMLGYDPDLEAAPYDVKYAKFLMKKAGYAMNDPRIKNLSLLHTDGLLTVKIAKRVQADLRRIGMKVKLVEVPYQNENKWIGELVSGKHDLYFMGYKAGYEKLFTDEAEAQEIDSASLIEPLFKTNGEANFTNYSNPEVDKLLDQVSGYNLALKSERHNKLKKINQILFKDKPAVVLFYIEKL